MTEPEPAPPARADRSLWIVLGSIGILVVVAIIVVLTRPMTAPLDPDSPEGVVQSYASAVLEGDRDTAEQLLAIDECRPASLFSPDVRLVLAETKIHGDTAIVDVAISHEYSGGIGSSYRTDDHFELVREAGEWRITVAPWNFTICYPEDNR